MKDFLRDNWFKLGILTLLFTIVVIGAFFLSKKEPVLVSEKVEPVAIQEPAKEPVSEEVKEVAPVVTKKKSVTPSTTQPTTQVTTTVVEPTIDPRVQECIDGINDLNLATIELNQKYLNDVNAARKSTIGQESINARINSIYSKYSQNYQQLTIDIQRKKLECGL